MRRNVEPPVINHVPFVKMSGAGNDFVIIAQRDLPNVDPGWLSERLCTRAMSIGADGMIVITPKHTSAVAVAFYNPDGSVAEMCGRAMCGALRRRESPDRRTRILADY